MECKNCNQEMHKRGKNAALAKVIVYVCPKCGAVAVVSEDEIKWEN